MHQLCEFHSYDENFNLVFILCFFWLVNTSPGLFSSVNCIRVTKQLQQQRQSVIMLSNNIYFRLVRMVILFSVCWPFGFLACHQIIKFYSAADNVN